MFRGVVVKFKMADISKNLQSYLNRNGEKETAVQMPSDRSGSGAGFSLGKYMPFNKSLESEPPVKEDVANSWFSQAQRDPLFPSLTRKQRILGFIICLLMGTFCFSLAMLYLPMLVLKARKFSVLYTLGSLFVIFSFSFLWGPFNHMKHLFSTPRLPFTTAYFGTLFATLYFALWTRSTALTVIFAIIQILTLVWYIVSYIPGGQTGLNFFSKVFYAAASKTVSATLPV